ncbi:hypothetical protein GCM10023168_33950 [Fodinibacter luteus]|uniref:histidine kinase n=1 Tax=Fodinibacter luteus TaxID=552064 RepID=A0ABP8KPT6_9MICO
MRLRHLSEVGLVAVAFAVAAAVATQAGRTWADLLFVGVLLSFLFLLARLVWRSVVRSHRARQRERQVVAVRPSEAARRAVEDERVRLSNEIDRSVRRSLRAVRSLVAGADEADDPRPGLVAIQAESRTAMAELRRQLGLIDSDGNARGEDPVIGKPTTATSSPLHPLSRLDVATVLALWALIAVENALVADTERPASWLMSALLALTVLTRRLVPVLTALAGATILMLGVVLDAPVGDGFSFPLIVGLLLWSLLEQKPTPLCVACAGVLLGCAVGSRYAHDPTNGPINIVVLSIVALAASVVGRARRSRAASQHRADRHQAQVTTAREAATTATRREVARELHDVVSHAVSLVAVQAGAAELAWPRHPDATRAGLRAIDETVAAALAELDASGWGQAPAPPWGDVAHTVGRLRSAGLTVSLETAGRPPDHLLPTVHRLVQEALTNVLKHAPGATAAVLVVSDPVRTRVEVTDNGPAPAPAGLGYGLAGLEDRVTAAGGTFSVGPTPQGGFAVSAVLPHAATGARQQVAS